MTQDERILRLLDLKIPVYLKHIPEKNIQKDCQLSLSIKRAARESMKRRLENDPAAVEQLEKEYADA